MTGYDEALSWFRADPGRVRDLDDVDNRSAAITIVNAVLAGAVPAGRDLTAQDVRNVMPTREWGAAEIVAERLNRIARPSGGVGHPVGVSEAQPDEHRDWVPGVGRHDPMSQPPDEWLDYLDDLPGRSTVWSPDPSPRSWSLPAPPPDDVTVVYIAGPMTGLPNYNLPAFAEAAESLTRAGFDARNPGHRGVVEGHTWQDYIRDGLRMLLDCDAVALLPGWGASRGASLEVTVARSLGMPVHPIVELVEGEPPAPEPQAAEPPFAVGDRVRVKSTGKVVGLHETIDRLRAELAETRDRRDYLQGQLDIIYDAEYSRNDALKRRIEKMGTAGDNLAGELDRPAGTEPEVRALIDRWRSVRGDAPTPERTGNTETATEWRVTASIPSGGEAAEEFFFERDAVWQGARWHECGWLDVRLFSRSVRILRRESKWELVQRPNDDFAAEAADGGSAPASTDGDSDGR